MELIEGLDLANVFDLEELEYIIENYHILKEENERLENTFSIISVYLEDLKMKTERLSNFFEEEK